MTSVYIFIGVLIFVALLIFKCSKSFFKALFTSVLGGIGAICAVGALSTFVPISICINWLTLTISALFSVPGVIMLLLINTFCV
ncbi:MAG: pro-sigmaK processing inhibitor BofA family protein [Clostridia bacterium]|nr:pro-sigmaK processing inhibitor BofA family protein [Clostridia bacterium]